MLDGHPTKFAAGEQFSYCNGGFVVLALIAERVSGMPFHDLIDQRVCVPAGMVDTAFLRSDELPGRAALGYLTVDGTVRTQRVSPTCSGQRRRWHLFDRCRHPVDCGSAFFGGRLVPAEWVAEMVRPRSVISDRERYGLGFWLDGAEEVQGWRASRGL